MSQMLYDNPWYARTAVEFARLTGKISKACQNFNLAGSGASLFRLWVLKEYFGLKKQLTV